MDTDMIKSNGTGVMYREELGATEISRTAETAGTAAAAHAEAAVKSRYALAVARPRDWDDVRQRLLRECARPGFAEQAIYHKPIGKGVEGPSIRFVEAALRCMTNVYPATTTVFDDATKRIVRQSVTDLEGNITYDTDVVVDKTVERSSPGDRIPLSTRTNSQGRKVYVVPATDDEILNKGNALVSKALRTNGLRLLPGWLVDEAIRAIRKTQADRDAKDPDAARRALVDAFGELGVKASDLKAYLDHDLDACSPAELRELRAVYQAIREGETRWADVMEERRGDTSGKVGGAARAKVASQAAEAREQEEAERHLGNKEGA